MTTVKGTPEDDILLGTQSKDSILGFAGNDLLTGEDGNDALKGGVGEDTLIGGGGSDTLKGGVGKDILVGGAGDDTYISDSVADRIAEASNGGIDTVKSSVSWTLGNNLNELILTGTGAINGIGNNLSNLITGNAANNSLNGRRGNDFLIGSDGNDTLKGGDDSDILQGGIGNDMLAGSRATTAKEIDILTGGAGRDQFILGSATQVFYDNGDPTTAGKTDYALITDFQTSKDIIQLNGQKSDYLLMSSPSSLPTGIAIYLDKPADQPDELIGITQGNSNLSLDEAYFRFEAVSFPPAFSLADLGSSNSFVINGVNESDQSGVSVSNAGDVNGDGFADLIIGAPGAGAFDNYGYGYAAGKSYVVFGQAEDFGTSFDLSELDGSNGFAINGIAGDRSGSSVSNAGDINGDGFDDLIIGAPEGNSPFSNYDYGAGKSYMVFGQAEDFSPNFDLAELDGTSGFVINGTNISDASGSSVSTAGDINGDGFDDLIIGASDSEPFSYYGYGAGKSYVVFGQAEGFSPNFDLAELDGGNGFVINGTNPGDRSGFSVSSAGDVNGDDLDDMIVGATGAGDYAGASYVVFGQVEDFSASFDLSELDGSNGFAINGINPSPGDRSGFSVSSAGDVNGDGLDDVIVGALFADASSQSPTGKSYVVFGQAEDFSASFDLADVDGSNGFAINGTDADDFSGFSVSSAGDVNGDSFDDLIVGAPLADPNSESAAGKSYVVFGQAEDFSASFDLSELDGTNGFLLNGIAANDFSGTSVSAAGDVNGDGFDDLTVGADGADPNGQDGAGESYVMFGRDFTDKVNRPGTSGNDTLTGTDGDDILVGNQGNDILTGGKGIDVLYGGGGDDILGFGSLDRHISGGSGTDMLSVNVSGVNLDLTTVSNNMMTDIEKIDLTGTGNNSLIFKRLDILDLSSTTNQLIIDGNQGDSVTSTGQGWSFEANTTLSGIEYNQYAVGATSLLVETTLTQTLT